jgi:hypothetical protein
VRALAFGAVAVVVAVGTFAPPAPAALTPAEQAWVTPLIKVWNLQNAGLHLVLQQAAAKNALIAGAKPDNLRLTTTLAVLVDCKTPTDLIRKAGTPPTPRLAGFRDALNAACIHDSNGAQDFAKAIGAVTKNQAAKAKQFLTQGTLEFRKGSTQIQKAYRALTSIGGGGGLKA